jgi:hypothetical protein
MALENLSSSATIAKKFTTKLYAPTFSIFGATKKGHILWCHRSFNGIR